MKDKISNFFKNKFNITLVILQVVAIFSYFLGSLWWFCSIAFFVLESAFFIVWGVKILVEIKPQRYSNEILEQLPYNEQEKERIRRQSMNTTKNNKLMGWMLIALGVVVIISLFVSIF